MNKIGDRIFYECYDGSIGSSRIVDIKPDSYDDGHGPVNFNMLVTWKSENSGASCAIEDYNTLPKSNPKVREFIKGKRDEIKGKLNDLYSSTGAKTREEKEFVLKIMNWMAKNDFNEMIEYSDLI